MNRTQEEIFRKGSKTYFNSSLFFPREIRKDVFTLYAFVRAADDFVDKPGTPDTKGFAGFKSAFLSRGHGGKPQPCITDFLELMRRKKFDPSWPKIFLQAMESDLHPRACGTLAATRKYMVGSAEVIGLMMSTIMGLPPKSQAPARLLGRAMQYINFIRDIDEDNKLGRTYLPRNGMRNAGLRSIDKKDAMANPDGFRRFVRSQIRIYRGWQSVAEKGFRFIPKELSLVPVKTASDMYTWTASVIERDPFVVFRKKVKPSRIRIFFTIIRNLITL